MATISTKRRDRPQPRSSNQALPPAARLAAAQGAELPACDEAREQELAAEVAELKKKYAASVQVRASQNTRHFCFRSPPPPSYVQGLLPAPSCVLALHDEARLYRAEPRRLRCALEERQARPAAGPSSWAGRAQVNLDLGREQWEGIKRAKELQRELNAAAAAKELAFLKGRLEGLAAVVAGVAEQHAAAATLRSRAEAAEASLSSLQVRSGAACRSSRNALSARLHATATVAPVCATCGARLRKHPGLWTCISCMSEILQI